MQLMKNYTSEDIKKALRAVRIKKGDIVNMHSSFLTLGRFISPVKRNPVEETISTILDYLGEGGTLVAPAFNFEFCKGETFNRQETPSKNMGVISEAIRTWEGAKRSSHPMQSVSAIGKMAEYICEPDTVSAFSIGGSFDRMLELDAKILLYGVSFQAASFVHYSEEHLEVPYRFWKSFGAEYVDDDISETREYKMYVRDLDLNPQLQVNVLRQKMIEENNLKSASLGMGQIYSTDYVSFHESANRMIKEDAYYLVDNKEEVLANLKNRNK